MTVLEKATKVQFIYHLRDFLKMNNQKESLKFCAFILTTHRPEKQHKFCLLLKPSRRMMSLLLLTNQTAAMTTRRWRWMARQRQLLRPMLPWKWTASRKRSRGRRPLEPPQCPAGCRRAGRSWSLSSASSMRQWTTVCCLACTNASTPRWVHDCDNKKKKSKF